MPPKGYPFNKQPGVYLVQQPVKLIARIGTRVYIDYPTTLAYDIKSNDDILSVGIAINKARHDIRYSNLDWSKVYYTTGKFMYQEILIEK